jgi:hypothetical protein
MTATAPKTLRLAQPSSITSVDVMTIVPYTARSMPPGRPADLNTVPLTRGAWCAENMAEGT